MPTISDRRSLGPNWRPPPDLPDDIVNAATTSPDIHGPCHTCAPGSRQASPVGVVASSRRSFQPHLDL